MLGFGEIRKAAQVWVPILVPSDRGLTTLLRYLGIDVGSTSSRLCLYTSVTHRMIEIECPDRGKVRNSFDPGDFSSRCYPFHTGSKVYKGNTEDRDSQAASLKPVLLLLSGLSEQELHPLIIEYPVAQKILNNLHSTTFRRRLDTGVQQLFRILWKATVEVCMENELCITGIGVTTPQQWPSQVDKLYEQVILESFCARTSAYLRINTESIYFLGETQALAHFLFHHHANKVWVRGFEEDVLLILDFGGQNLVSVLFTFLLRHGPNDLNERIYVPCRLHCRQQESLLRDRVLAR
jgi:hypothetical protein